MVGLSGPAARQCRALRRGHATSEYFGAFAWGYFITDTNILDLVLERIWDPLDDIVFVLIALSGVYWLLRVLTGGRSRIG